MPITRIRKTTIAAALLALCAALLVPLAGSPAFTPVAAQSAAWVKIETDGRLTLNGQTIYLRGSNFANINALGADIGTNNPADVPETNADYAKMHEMGGNHVRFGLSYGWWANNKTAFYSMLDQQVGYARANGITMVLNLFVLPDECYEGYSTSCGLWTNTTLQTQLRNFWKDVVAHYKSEPTVVGIDPVNEPTPPGPSWCDTWFTLADQIIADVTAINPNILTFAEACSDATFTRLLKGSGVVYQTHFYDPMQLTHASNGNFTNIQCRTGKSYPGAFQIWDGSTVTFNKTTLSSGSGSASISANYAIDWAKQNKVPLYIGEWGSQSACSGWAQWITDVGSILNADNVHWAHYSWRALPGNWDTFASTGTLTVQNQQTYNAMVSLWGGSSLPAPTAAPATNTPTKTAVLPTATVKPSNTPVPPTATVKPSSTPAPGTPTAKPSNTPVPPTKTAVPATSTANPSNTPVPPTATAVPPLGSGSGSGSTTSLQLLYKTSVTDFTSGEVAPIFEIQNSGSAPVALSELKIRYYFTADGAPGFQFDCQYAQMGCQNVIGQIVALSSPATNADHYVEVSFQASAGTIPPNKRGVLMVAFHSTSWSDFTQTNDYSFNGTVTNTSYSWDKVALYRNGTKVWGTEPSSAPAVNTVKLQAAPANNTSSVAAQPTQTKQAPIVAQAVAAQPTQAPAPTTAPAIVPTAGPAVAANPTNAANGANTTNASSLPSTSNTTNVSSTVPPLPQVIESSNSLIQRVGTWTIQKTGSARGGQYLFSSGKPGDSLGLSFEGTGIDVLYVQHPSLGIFAIEVDGSLKQTVDSKSTTTAFGVVVPIRNLPAGQHTMHVYPVSGVIGIDAFGVETQPKLVANPTQPAGQALAAVPTKVAQPQPAQPSQPTQPAQPAVVANPGSDPNAAPAAAPTAAPTSTPIPLPQSLPFSASFDAPSGWQSSSGWQVIPGQPGIAWLAGKNAQPGALTQTIDVNLQSAQKPQLTFKQRTNLFGADSIVVQGSVDSGANWITLDQQPGAVTDWTQRTVDLSAYKGRLFRLQFIVNASPANNPNDGTRKKAAERSYVLDGLTINEAPPTPPTAVPVKPTQTPPAAPTSVPLPAQPQPGQAEPQAPAATVAPQPAQAPQPTTVSNNNSGNGSNNEGGSGGKGGRRKR